MPLMLPNVPGLLKKVGAAVPPVHAITAAVFYAVCAIGSSASAADEPRRPNIVVIVSDDAGYADFSMQGDKRFPTPHIDSIAAHGVRFTDGYVTAPVCSPSRAGLLTGRYQQRF